MWDLHDLNPLRSTQGCPPPFWGLPHLLALLLLGRLLTQQALDLQIHVGRLLPRFLHRLLPRFRRRRRRRHRGRRRRHRPAAILFRSPFPSAIFLPGRFRPRSRHGRKFGMVGVGDQGRTGGVILEQPPPHLDQFLRREFLQQALHPALGDGCVGPAGLASAAAAAAPAANPAASYGPGSSSTCPTWPPPPPGGAAAATGPRRHREPPPPPVTRNRKPARRESGSRRRHFEGGR